MLAAPGAQHLLRHAVISFATLMFSSKDALVHLLMLSMYCLLGAPSSSFPRHHSENACLNTITRNILSACMSKEGHLSFDNLGWELRLVFSPFAAVSLCKVAGLAETFDVSIVPCQWPIPP